MNIEARPRSARTFTLRLLGLLLALVLAGGLASASHVKAAKASDGLELTFTKWITAYPQMGGVVGGDIEGRFAGYIFSLTTTDDGHFTYITARYGVVAEDPSENLTAIMQVTQNNWTGVAQLHGVVTEGWLAGEQVVGQYKVLSTCAGNPNGPCFKGTLRVNGD
jgi:hypothetical protein